MCGVWGGVVEWWCGGVLGWWVGGCVGGCGWVLVGVGVYVLPESML